MNDDLVNAIREGKYEIIPEPRPQDETPRQFVLRVTGKDFPDLTVNERDLTWSELEDAGALPSINRIIQVASLPPRIRLKRKE
jgi:hypothetical protein